MNVETNSLTNTSAKVACRVSEIDWDLAYQSLDTQGFAVAQQLLSQIECQSLTNLYQQEQLFRKRIVMDEHGYGRGEYKYFTYPLPDLVEHLRTAIYLKLAPIANHWNAQMNISVHFPETHGEFLAVCHDSGQLRPTPLLLKYGPGDYNCLHQDLYGEHFFPMQLTILLAEPGREFTGGEFILTEQRPRMQSRPRVVPLRQGDAVIFAVNKRPVQGRRGNYRVTMRHGVSEILSGHRHTAGIIFHDAK